MSPSDFSKLPPEYQHLLNIAKEKHNLHVTPLQVLAGGRTGAFLYLVSITGQTSRQVEHRILKFDRVNPKAKPTEFERHRLAVSQAPSDFARENMAKLAYEIEHEGVIALFYDIAGQSLQNYRTLASQESQSRLEMLFGTTNDYLLKKWNAELTFEQALHPQKILEKWLGHRLKAGGPIGSFIKDAFHTKPETHGFLIQGQVFPNPLSFGLDPELWPNVRLIDIITGFQHGDLNMANILAKFAPDSENLEGYFLIDFALYKANMPLLYDQCYLEMSYLIRELERVPLQKWVSLVTHFSGRDLLNPKEVPVELAGACQVIVAARKSFERWVNETHPSLSDDLWGQFWLAAIAAGLNFCNKVALSTEERLASLIYSAVHLKRYSTQFGVRLPAEVRLLYDASQWDQSASITKSPHQKNLSDRSSQLNGKQNLPIQLTSFIGRQTELKAVKDLLMRDSIRLVTLIGPGGTGKTRLSLQVATDLISDFKDGVLFVDLAPIREPESVLGAIARTVDLRESTDRALLDELKDHLQDQTLLLVLDNFEQVTAAGHNIGKLLSYCPLLKVLVTSREALHIRGEHIYPVPPLALPQADHKQSSVEQLTQYEAVRLFIERAQAANPNFQVTNENAPAVAEICFRLDGLPLAIELATARLRLFSPESLLERIGSRLQLLRGGARDLPTRQQTLRDTINWSYELLDLEEQRLFALLSVFPDCTFEAVEAVAGEIEFLNETGMDVLERLTSLVDKSLIHQAERGASEPRLRMLETIREYAVERLREDADFNAAVHRSHAAYFAASTQHQWERLISGEREAALREMEFELENVLIAWRYWVAEGNLEQLQKITDCLWLLCDEKGWYHVMVSLTSDLLNVLATNPSTPERVEEEIMLQTSLARALLATKGYTEEVEQAYARALELCERAGEIPQLFPVLRGLASFYVLRTEPEKAVQMGERILQLADQLDDIDMKIEGQMILGYNMAFLKYPEIGLDYLEKAIASYNPERQRVPRRGLGANPGVASLMVSALFLWMLGYPDRARQRAADALRRAQKMNHPYSMAYAHFHNGLLNLWLRNPEIAHEQALAVLDLAQEHGFQIWSAVGTCLRGAALAGTDSFEMGLALIEQGLNAYRGLKTPPIFWPLLLHLCAGAYGAASRPDVGLTLLNEAIQIGAAGSDRTLTSGLIILKGDLTLALSSDKRAEAEALYQRAVNIAREVHTPMFELQAATRLSRLWHEQGNIEQARKVLNGAYSQITEGFTTPDLMEASALLAELSS